MGTRYFIPRFHGEFEGVADQIDKTLKEHNAIRIRTNKKAGVVTFALANDADYSYQGGKKSWMRWQLLSKALEQIHPNCVAMSYSRGEKFNRVFGQIE